MPTLETLKTSASNRYTEAVRLAAETDNVPDGIDSILTLVSRSVEQFGIDVDRQRIRAGALRDAAQADQLAAELADLNSRRADARAKADAELEKLDREYRAKREKIEAAFWQLERDVNAKMVRVEELRRRSEGALRTLWGPDGYNASVAAIDELQARRSRLVADYNAPLHNGRGPLPAEDLDRIQREINSIDLEIARHRTGWKEA